MTASPILQTFGLSAGYRNGGKETAVVTDVSLSLSPGSVACLLGPNGAGKSTLLRTVAGQQKPLEGTVTIGGMDLQHLPADRLSRLISVVYTERSHAGALTVGETVSLGRQPYTGFFGRLDRTDRRIVEDSLEAVGMLHLIHRYLGTLSDGERQKVMIARALAQQTPLMLLDEPTSFLDVASRLEVMALIRRMAVEKEMAIVLSTHDIANALAVATDLWLILPGGEMMSGPVAEVIASGAMDRLFTGRNIVFDTPAGDYRLKE